MLKKYIDSLILFIVDCIALFFILEFFYNNLGYDLIFSMFDTEIDRRFIVVFVGLNVLYWVLIFFFRGVYKRWLYLSRFDHFIAIFKSTAYGLALLAAYPIARDIGQVILLANGEAIVLLQRKLMIAFKYFFIIFISISFIHLAYYSFRKFLIKYGLGKKRTLILGFDDHTKSLIRHIQKDPSIVFAPLGLISDNCEDVGKDYVGVSVLGVEKDIKEIVQKKRINSVIIGYPTTDKKIYNVMPELSRMGVSFYMPPDIYDMIRGYVKTQQIVGIPFIEILPEHMPAWEARAKRIMDIVVSLAVLLVFSPLYLLLAILIKAGDRGAVFFKQERLGMFGKPFIIYKFRTMVMDAEKMSGPVWAQKKDPRITKLGKFLRKTRLDEFPQFYNVLRGDMSIVGPRPEREHFVRELIEKIPLYDRRLLMKPGLTGWAQIHLNYDVDLESVEQKVLYDLYYLENMSVILDLKIMLRTFFIVLFQKGAH